MFSRMNPISTIERKIHHPDAGLFVLRVGLGVMLTTFGILKLMAGKPTFEWLGNQLAMFGIHWHPVLWGLMAALVETFGGLCLVLGVCFRPAALLLVCNLFVACATLWHGGPDFSSGKALSDWLQGFAMPCAFAVGSLALLLTGPGRFAFGKGAGTSGSRGSSKREE
jgi:putative oxidoreductase